MFLRGVEMGEDEAVAPPRPRRDITVDDLGGVPFETFEKLVLGDTGEVLGAVVVQ
jgi:hypothetical protein